LPGDGGKSPLDGGQLPLEAGKLPLDDGKLSLDVKGNASAGHYSNVVGVSTLP
jgi:hypothetical protein